MLSKWEVVFLHQYEKFALLDVEDDDFGGFGYAINRPFDELWDILIFWSFGEHHKLKLLVRNFIFELFFIGLVDFSPLVVDVLGYLKLAVPHFELK